MDRKYIYHLDLPSLSDSLSSFDVFLGMFIRTRVPELFGNLHGVLELFHAVEVCERGRQEYDTGLRPGFVDVGDERLQVLGVVFDGNLEIHQKGGSAGQANHIGG